MRENHGGFLRMALAMVALAAAPARAVEIADDIADPLYINKLGDFVSVTSADIGKYFRLRETASYGFSNRFSLAADMRYRLGGARDENGFSNLGVMGTYRAGSGNTGATDVMFGFGFGGPGVIPNYSDEVYSVGVRTGRQWAGMTLAATAMTNWIFDKNVGQAYIDLSPEVYFRIQNNLSMGFGATIRKSTTPMFDQEWLNFKIGSTVGKTGWFMNLGYEIETQDVRIGGSINMLF